MIAAALSLLLFAGSAAVESSSMSTFAAASPRPAVCRAASQIEESQLWGRVRGGRTQQYCLRLGWGYARLSRAPSESIELARQAALLLPSESEARVLEGRALLRLGDWNGAYAALAPHVLGRGRPLGDVAALRELGVAASQTGKLTEAAQVYRALIPRVAFTSDSRLMRIAVLEGASVFMALGPQGLADATLYLSDARRQPAVPGYEDLLVALLALSLDRAGRGEEAEVLIHELEGPWGLEAFATDRDKQRVAQSALPTAGADAARPLAFSEHQPMLVDGELHAAIGCAAIRSDPRLARSHLSAYLDGPGGRGPYAEWARARLLALTRGAGQ